MSHARTALTHVHARQPHKDWPHVLGYAGHAQPQHHSSDIPRLMSEPSFLHGAGLWSCCARIAEAWCHSRPHSTPPAHTHLIIKSEAQDGVYCLPGSSTRILRIVAETELWGPHFSEETWKWTVAIVGPDGSLWGIPGNARRVLRISEGHTELVGPVLEGEHKWHSAVLAPDGCPTALEFYCHLSFIKIIKDFNDIDMKMI